MFGFNFSFEEMMQDYIIEIKIGNQTQRQLMQAPEEIIKAQFAQLVKETTQNPQPVKVKLIREDLIWDKFENKRKTQENYIQFANKRYMEAFPEEFKEE